jgi:hypothetical protein
LKTTCSIEKTQVGWNKWFVITAPHFFPDYPHKPVLKDKVNKIAKITTTISHLSSRAMTTSFVLGLLNYFHKFRIGPADLFFIGG